MPVYLLIIGTMLLSLWAMWRFKSVYNHYSQVRSSSGATGGEVAAAILDRAGIHDVRILAADEMLGDHYDPTRRILVLSSQNFYGDSLAALGVAAHECGHAIQHRMAYSPLQWRMAAVGITNVANQIVMWVPVLGIFSGLLKPYTALWVMSAAWGVLMLFNLVTLPVEFDASNRAKRILQEMGYIGTPAELNGVHLTLDAAGWTYVAAFITSLGWFLFHILPLLTGRRRD